MPHDFSHDRSAHTSTRAAADNQGASGVNRPTVVPVQKAAPAQKMEQPRPIPTIFTPPQQPEIRPPQPGPFQLNTLPVQRQVIQLQWKDVDDELAKAAKKAGQAREQVTKAEYGEAIASYRELKGYMKEIYSRHSAGKDSIYRRHIDKIDDYVRDTIALFREVLQRGVDEYVAYYGNLYIKYEAEYHKLYAEMAAGLYAREDISKLTDALNQAGKAHFGEFDKNKSAAGAIVRFATAAKEDNDVAYDNGRKSESVIPSTKLVPVAVDVLQDYNSKNIKLYDNHRIAKSEINNVKKQPENDPLRENTVLLLLAGSKERKEAVAQLPGIDLAQQMSIFTQVNKHHRSDDIAQVTALILAVGMDHLAPALELIDAAGAKGTIAEIKIFYEDAKAVKGERGLPALTGFLKRVQYTSLTGLAGFIKTAGKYLDLDAMAPIWNEAEKNSHTGAVIDLFNEGIIPGSLIAAAAEIGWAFASKKGKSEAADWGKLLTVKGWDRSHLVELALAFDAGSGNVTAAHWAATAEKNPALQGKPDEVRATARLDHFANEDWYNKYDTGKRSSAKKAQKKYTQLLYALLGDKKLTGLGNINFSNIQGDFLSMLIFFHRHIASFASNTGQGFDQEETGGGKYARSNKDHPLNEQYKKLLEQEGANVGGLLLPLNHALLDLQNQGRVSKDERSVTEKKLKTVSYLTGSITLPSAGLPSHNLKVLGEQQRIAAVSGNAKAKETLFNVKSQRDAPRSSRVIDDKSFTIDSLVDRQKAALSGEIKTAPQYGNFHDGLLQDRGRLVTDISDAINAISGGNKVLRAIGAENHPSLILNVAKEADRFCYDNVLTYNTTKSLIPLMARDFNAAPGQDVKITERGSFGFQRPTLADTGDAVRLWPGYAPVTSLLPGLTMLVEKLRSKGPGPAPDLTHTGRLLGLAIDTARPILHVEGLKTAMRHAFIALNKKIDGSAPAEKKRVYEWLRTRMLIKLQQSGILLDKAASVYGASSTATPEEKNKHFLVTADMTDKLQEYTMLYTAATLDTTANPNEDHTQTGKFKDSSDVYEQKVVSKLGAADYRIFYLDSGEQALVAAGILANRFVEQKDEKDRQLIPPSPYVSRNPYFEIGLYKGDKRSNLEKKDTGGKIVHADLSPVITSGINRPKPSAETQQEVKRTWQRADGTVEKRDVIPIIDVTNSSMNEVTGLGSMPDHFIIVESLTKHEQLGADKFIMGRLIAVSKTQGTQGNDILVKTNFLDLAQKTVGPVANNAYNPLLAQIRANMDKALYSDDLA